MSNVYIHRLERVQMEYEATRSALEYVQRNWQKQNVFLDIPNSAPEDFRRAASNIDTVFVVRLFSVFEGILTEHLAEYHSSLSIPEDARAVWLIDRVAQRRNPPISSPLRLQVHAVRQHRNFQVHPHGPAPPNYLFEELLFRLNKFTAHLPEPR